MQTPQRESSGGEIFDLASATILDINRAFDAGSLSSLQLVELYLARIEAYDDSGPGINAVISLSETSRAEAASLDEERRRLGPRGLMHGIPVLLKDNFATHDLPTTAGSLALVGVTPREDAYVVGALRRAGAVILGKVNMSEFATPAGWGSHSSVNGVTRNPYDLQRDPGGSSGGTAAAVAANFATVGFGTDTGGSIRGPAAANGLVGLRPTHGLLSRRGIVPQAFSLDVPGPMARNVTDLAVALGAVTGVDRLDPLTVESSERSYSDYTPFLRRDALRGTRVGVLREFFGGDAEVDGLTEMAIQEMADAGAVLVDPVTLGNDFFELTNGLRGRINAEFQPYIESYLAGLDGDHPRTLSGLIAFLEPLASSGSVNPGLVETLRTNLEIGGLDNPEYVEAVRNVLPRIRQLVLDIMEESDLDVLVYPTSRCTARPLHMLDDSSADCAGGPSGANLASFARLPDLQVPAGFTSEGLPTTISFVGRPYSEPELIGIAFSYETRTGHRRPPSLVPPLPGETFQY